MTAFDDLLSNKNIVSPQADTLNESDEIYFGLVNAIHNNDKTSFEQHFNKKNKSHPTKESQTPFVNDDFLIFCLIVGIKKFNLDKSWITGIISIRSRSRITITLENILNDNYYSTSNLYEIVLMHFQLYNPALITDEFISKIYRPIVENTELFANRSDFQIICALRAYDLITETKESPNRIETSWMLEFNASFLKRVKILSLILQTSFFVAILYGAMKLISVNPTIKAFFDNLKSAYIVFTVFGLSLLGNLSPNIKRIFFELLLRAFGYSNYLIKELREKKK